MKKFREFLNSEFFMLSIYLLGFLIWFFEFSTLLSVTLIFLVINVIIFSKSGTKSLVPLLFITVTSNVPGDLVYMTSVDDIFKDYPRIDIKKEASVLLKNGNKLGISMVDISDCNSNTINNLEDYRYRVYDENGRFTAVYEYNNTYKELKPVKMFLE